MLREQAVMTQRSMHQRLSENTRRKRAPLPLSPVDWLQVQGNVSIHISIIVRAIDFETMQL